MSQIAMPDCLHWQVGWHCGRAQGCTDSLGLGHVRDYMPGSVCWHMREALLHERSKENTQVCAVKVKPC